MAGSSLSFLSYLKYNGGTVVQQRLVIAHILLSLTNSEVHKIPEPEAVCPSCTTSFSGIRLTGKTLKIKLSFMLPLPSGGGDGVKRDGYGA